MFLEPRLRPVVTFCCVMGTPSHHRRCTMLRRVTWCNHYDGYMLRVPVDDTVYTSRWFGAPVDK
jgi:hypothetical protein